MLRMWSKNLAYNSLADVWAHSFFSPQYCNMRKNRRLTLTWHNANFWPWVTCTNITPQSQELMSLSSPFISRQCQNIPCCTSASSNHHPSWLVFSLEAACEAWHDLNMQPSDRVTHLGNHQTGPGGSPIPCSLKPSIMYGGTVRCCIIVILIQVTPPFIIPLQ